MEECPLCRQDGQVRTIFYLPTGMKNHFKEHHTRSIQTKKTLRSEWRLFDGEILSAHRVKLTEICEQFIYKDIVYVLGNLFVRNSLMPVVIQAKWLDELTSVMETTFRPALQQLVEFPHWHCSLYGYKGFAWTFERL